MNQPSTVIDAIVRAPIVASEGYNGILTYESPRLTGAYVGRMIASLKGVFGSYTAYDRTLPEPIDSYIINDEDRGNLVPDDQQATITGTGSPSFRARGASEVRSSFHIPGNSVDLEFSALSLDVTYSQQPASYRRYLFADSEISAHRAFRGEFRERTVVIAQAPRTDGRNFVIAVHDGEPLDLMEERSLWYATNFLCGTKAGNYLLEAYSASGSLISRQFRAGHEELPQVINLFDAQVMPPKDFVRIFINGVHDALTNGFPVDVILEHLFDSANSVLDFQVQNCLLAVHAAFEAWHKIEPPDIQADKKWLADNKSRLYAAVDDLLKAAPDRVKTALSYGINGAANFGTREKERRFFADWGIDVSGPDEKKALDLRNGLLHDGYFNKRFEDIGPVEQQLRVNALGTLKNLIALILFRAIGYSDRFLSQRDYFTYLKAVEGQAIWPSGPRSEIAPEPRQHAAD